MHLDRVSGITVRLQTELNRSSAGGAHALKYKNTPSPRLQQNRAKINKKFDNPRWIRTSHQMANEIKGAS